LFNSTDLVSVFQAGQYEDDKPHNSAWATGDWTADREFDSNDLVAVLQSGKYERGVAAAKPVAIPEPSTVTLAALALGWLGSIGRGRDR
jgi:hypothetical protein